MPLPGPQIHQGGHEHVTHLAVQSGASMWLRALTWPPETPRWAWTGNSPSRPIRCQHVTQSVQSVVEGGEGKGAGGMCEARIHKQHFLSSFQRERPHWRAACSLYRNGDSDSCKQFSNIKLNMYICLKGLSSENLQGSKVISIKSSSFCIEPLIFILYFKGNSPFKSQKNGFRDLSQNMWLIQINGAPAANNF